MIQTVIFKDYDTNMVIEVLHAGKLVAIRTKDVETNAQRYIALQPSLARELARVLNLFATVAEAEKESHAK